MESSASPPLGLEGTERQEQAQDREVEVVDHVLGVDDALGEGVEVLGDGQVRDDPAPDPSRRVTRPADDPQEEEGGGRGQERDDLILGERRDEHPHRDASGPLKDETDVPAEERPPLQTRRPRHDDLERHVIF